MSSAPDPGALFGALIDADALGVCLFDTNGTVVANHGASSGWTPAVGDNIHATPLFIGLADDIAAIRNSGKALAFSSLAMPGASESIDIDLRWLSALNLFAAISRPAGARVAEQAAAAQVVRDTRLLEERIREQQALINQQAEMMTLFVRHAPAAVAMLDDNLQVMLASERWKQEHGDPALTPAGVQTASPLTWPRVAEGLRLAMDGGVPSSRVEKTTLRGRPAWKRLAQAPWRRADGSIGGAILFCEDVTDAMLKAENLRARVEDLHKLGAEMDNLGRAVSNDLRAPVRQIDFFSRFLMDSRPAGLDPASRDYITQIRACAERIDRMMGALQRYMRLSERDIIPTRFDLGEIVMAAANDAREDLTTAGVTIRLRDTLSVEGDPALVSGLFSRLIDNTIKYAGAGATIVIDCFEEEDGILAQFSDDGPGIPAHLRRRAFDFFERLNAPSEIPGEGMGLAECRKIVELHGGAMTLDPDFDAGLRVLISLPRHARRAPIARPALAPA